MSTTPEVPNPSADDNRSVEPAASVTNPASVSRGRLTVAWPIIAVVVGGVIAASAGAISYLPRLTASNPTVVHETHTVTRTNLTVSVREEGKIASSENTEIKCQIRGGYGGRGGQSTVTWVIDPGQVVKKGDPLVRLDTKIIEETVSLGKTDTNIARAQLARTEAAVAKAKIGVEAYTSGAYRQQMEALENRRTIAQRELRNAKKALQDSEDLFRRGFVTPLEIEANRYNVTQRKRELDVVQTEIDVLKRLTKTMELERLNGQVIATEARLEGHKAGLQLEEGRLELAQQELDRCVIRAPRDGLVIYPSAAKWRRTPDITKGASVHNNQLLLLMPDLQKMEVEVGIHESIVERVQQGQYCRVTIAGKSYDARISSVADVARPAGWWSGTVVKYDAVVELPGDRGLRPAMTADVEIVIAQHEDVLTLPVDAVVEAGEQHHCWVETDGGVERRVVTLGDSNDSEVIVSDGVEENEKVILHPLLTVEEARRMMGDSLVYEVDRGDLELSFTEQGALESYNNTKIKCRVRGNSTINWVVESGTAVNAGDDLVHLENKQIEDFLHERTKEAYLSKDAATGFQVDAKVAELAIDEYLEGQYRVELLTLEKDLAVAEATLLTAQNRLAHTERLFDRGFATQQAVRDQEAAVQAAALEVGVKNTEIDVLKSFTMKEQVKRLEGEWESAREAARANDEVLRMDEERVALARQEMAYTVIRAERDGVVIYPETEDWSDQPDITEGATVRKDQDLLLMPDLSKMQVKFGIHESIIEQVKPGMRAIVRVPGQELVGEVFHVASTADPAGWWTGNVVKYDAIVRLPSVAGLKPGMSAEVQVILEERSDVLRLPLSAVVETSQGAYCWVGTPEKPTKRKVQLGANNTTYVEVVDGVAQGESVILEPVAVVEEARRMKP